MYVGQLYPWKGVDVLVRAMQDVPRGELTVVGGLPPEPDLERVKRLAAELGLEERVHFRGFVPPPELDAEKRQASVFVIPNLDSTTARLFTSPLKLFEAMACGRPIVASDLPSIGEVLEDGENALLVPVGSRYSCDFPMVETEQPPSCYESLRDCVTKLTSALAPVAVPVPDTSCACL